MIVKLGTLENNDDIAIVTVPLTLLDWPVVTISIDDFLEVVGLNTCEGDNYYQAYMIVELLKAG